MPDKHQPQKHGLMDGAGMLVAILAMAFAGWSAYEAHSARLEARQAIDAATRSATAAESSNTLAARSQSSYLVPSIQKLNSLQLAASTGIPQSKR